MNILTACHTFGRSYNASYVYYILILFTPLYWNSPMPNNCYQSDLKVYIAWEYK